jgi:MoaA/NifB/PqqE/SkfB family radical SAM enzyme
MNGQELDELRKQLKLPIDDFSKTIGISALDYQAQINKASIEDAGVVAKVLNIELQIERENLDNYGRTLSAQPTGPFSTGKIFAHPQEIANLKANPQKTAPITVEWHLSNSCNHDCPFCTFRESVHASPNRHAMFPDNLIDQTVEDLKEIGSKAVVYSGGGEPLLYPKVHEVMKKVADAGIHQGLVTNGANIEKSNVAEAIMQNVEWVRISVDAGSQEVYEKTHGVGRDFTRIVENIRQLVKKRKGTRPTIGVSFLLTMFNFTDLLPSARLFRDVGVDYFQVKPIVISAEERLASGNIFWRTGIFDQLVALPAQAKKPHYNVYTLGFKFVDMMTAVDRKQFSKCFGHPFYPVITATGAVFVCCLMIGKPGLCYGTLGEDMRFKKLWYSIQRSEIGKSVNVRDCPVNCKLSETNKVLEQVLGRKYDNEDFLN